MCRILKKEFLNSQVCKIIINAPNISKKAKAGQFVILRAINDSERIPLAISDYNKEDGTITIIFKIVGQSTFELANLNENECVCDIVGPLGNPSQVADIKKVLIICDDISCATALSIVKCINNSGGEIHSILNFENTNKVILKEEYEKITDKLILSIGNTKSCIDELEQLISEKNKYDKVIAIGSLKMMQAVCKITEKHNIKTIVSLNPIMVDGTGMCGSCRVTVDSEMKFACVDGPEFDGHKVDFDEIISRSFMYKECEEHRKEGCCNLLNKEVE